MGILWKSEYRNSRGIHAVPFFARWVRWIDSVELSFKLLTVLFLVGLYSLWTMLYLSAMLVSMELRGDVDPEDLRLEIMMLQLKDSLQMLEQLLLLLTRVQILEELNF